MYVWFSYCDQMCNPLFFFALIVWVCAFQIFFNYWILFFFAPRWPLWIWMNVGYTTQPPKKDQWWGFFIAFPKAHVNINFKPTFRKCLIFSACISKYFNLYSYFVFFFFWGESLVFIGNLLLFTIFRGKNSPCKKEAKADMSLQCINLL